MNFINLERAPDGRYILRINASLLKEADCLRAIMYRAFYGLSKPSDAWKADYGTAVHKALQYYYGTRRLDGLDHAQVVANARTVGMDFYANVFVPEDDWRTSGHLSATLNRYFKEYANDELEVEPDKDGKPLLERTFEIKYYEDAFCIVYLVGTRDMKALWQGRRLQTDHKTTGFWKNTGNPDGYLENFVTALQMSLYLWADEQETGEKSNQFLINGIFLKKATKSSEGTFFRRRLIEVPDKVRATNMKKVAGIVTALVEQLKQFVANPTTLEDGIVFESNFTRCEGIYAPCPFKCLCLANNAQHEAELITSQFEQRVYDPRKTVEEV